MRDILAWSLVFWFCGAAAACVPSVPSAGPAPSPAPSPPAEPASGGDASLLAGGSAGASARADAGGTDRPRGVSTDAAPASDGPVDLRRAEVNDAPAARAPRIGEVVIDELLVDPAGNDLGHEWIELANLSTEALDLSTLRVVDEATEIAVDAGVLAAGGLLVLGQSSDRAHNGDAPVAVAYGTKLSLNNGADRVAICAGLCAAGAVLDAVAWTAPWGEAYVGHAVVVERGGARCPAGEPYGTDGNFGSPGRANPPCPANDARDGGDAGAPDADALDGDEAAGER